MKKAFYILFSLIIFELPILATDISCSFTEKNADYNNISGKGIINYNNVLFSLNDKKKTITYSAENIPVEVLLYTDKLLKFKMNVNTENSENNYIVTISRATGAIKTEHHRKLFMKTYSPLSEYLKDSPKYNNYTSETDFYGNGTCLKQTKATINKF